jgi:hypothetical protein
VSKLVSAELLGKFLTELLVGIVGLNCVKGFG